LLRLFKVNEPNFAVCMNSNVRRAAVLLFAAPYTGGSSGREFGHRGSYCRSEYGRISSTNSRRAKRCHFRRGRIDLRAGTRRVNQPTAVESSCVGRANTPAYSKRAVYLPRWPLSFAE
jgi:hypothetical protein